MLSKAVYAENEIKKIRGPPAWAKMAKSVVAGYLLNKACDTVVVEHQQWYTGKAKPADIDDLLQLAGVCGAIIGMLDACEYVGYYPREWTHGVTSKVLQPRIIKALSREEYATIVFPAPYLCHNVVDAIGIGLHHLDRLKPQKVYPR
jgi:hypothetical protein